MPQDPKKDNSKELLGLLASRAPGPNVGVGPTPYKEIPWKDEDPLTRFFGGFTGTDDVGGGVAGVLGAAAAVANPLDDLARYIKGAKGVGRMAEFASVDDPRTISKFFEGTPNTYAPSKLPQSVMREPGAGMSIYDPADAREMGRLMTDMLDYNDPIERKLKEALNTVRERYPRMMGNVNSITMDRPKSLSKEAWGGAWPVALRDDPNSLSYLGGDLNPSSKMYLEFTGKQLTEDPRQWRLSELIFPKDAIAEQRFPELVDTATHELTHAQQALRRGVDESHLTQAERMAGVPYRKLTVEQSPWKAGPRAKARVMESGSMREPTAAERAARLTKVKINKLSGR